MGGIIGLIIQLISGAVGGNIAGAAMKQYNLGTIGNSIAGLIGGGVGAQIIGALVGGVAGLGAVLIAGETYTAYAAAIVVAITACWLFGVGSAARLSGSTTTIVMLVPHTGTFWIVALTRIGEVALGIACALVVVSIGERLQARWMRPRASDT